MYTWCRGGSFFISMCKLPIFFQNNTRVWFPETQKVKTFSEDTFLLHPSLAGLSHRLEWKEIQNRKLSWANTIRNIDRRNGQQKLTTTILFWKNLTTWAYQYRHSLITAINYWLPQAKWHTNLVMIDCSTANLAVLFTKNNQMESKKPYY